MSLRPSQRHVSVVVPVYNGSRTLTELVTRLLAVLASASASTEIILVNDGSRDESWAVISRLADAHPGVVGLDLSRNYGQQNALLAGIAATTGDIVVTIDDDLDYRPEDIPLLLAAVDGEHDVAYGMPAMSAGGLLRRAVAREARWVMMHLSPHGLFASSFRAFDASLQRAFPRAHTPYASLDVLLTWASGRPVAVPLPLRPRTARTRYGWGTLSALFATAMTGISVRPLQLASWVGTVLLAGGLGGLVVTFLRAPLSLAGVVLSALALLSGVQCMLLGILGAYVGRIHALSLVHPAPVVRERIGKGRELMVTSG